MNRLINALGIERGSFRLFGFLLALALIVMAGAVQAQTREPFPRSCCGEYDCLLHPVPRTQLERREDGWWLKKEQRLVPFDQTRRSRDDGVYICRTQMGLGTLIHPSGEKPCLFIPESDG